MTSILPELRVADGRRTGGSKKLVVAGSVSAAVVLLVVLVLVVTSVGGGGGSAQPSPLTLPPPTAWERTDLAAVTQPVVSGDRLVLYVGASGKLRVVSLFPGSGMTAWARDASSSEIAPGVPPVLTLVDGKVVFLQPLPTPMSAQLVAADVTDGTIAWRSEPGYFSGWPAVCPGDPHAVCVSGGTARAGDAAALTFDARTGNLRSALTVSPEGGRELAPGLFDGLQRDPEILVATDGPRVAWRRPLDEVFQLRGVSTDLGWNFDRIRREGMYVGSVPGALVSRTAHRYVFDLARTATVGLSAEDGKVLWRDQGSSYLCSSMLPCPGTGSQAVSTAADATDGGTVVGVRLRATGRLTVTRSGRRSSTRLSRDAAAVLEGFVPATGRTLWQVRVDRKDLLLDTWVPIGDGHHIAVGDKSGRLLLVDLDTGRTRPVRQQDRVTCQNTTSYRMRVGYPVASGQVLHVHSGQLAIHACAADRHRISGPPPVAARVVLGGGELAVWTDTTGVYAEPRSSTGAAKGDGGGDGGEGSLKALVLRRER